MPSCLEACRKERIQPCNTAGEVKYDTADFADKMVMVRFARHLVARLLARYFHQNEPPISYPSSNVAVYRSNANGGLCLPRLRPNLFYGEGSLLFPENFLQSHCLPGLAGQHHLHRSRRIAARARTEEAKSSAVIPGTEWRVAVSW